MTSHYVGFFKNTNQNIVYKTNLKLEISMRENTS